MEIIIDLYVLNLLRYDANNCVISSSKKRALNLGKIKKLNKVIKYMNRYINTSI